MASLTQDKAEARKAAAARRTVAYREAAQAVPRATAALIEALRGREGATVSGYWPIRSELDPRPALEALAGVHRIVLPVVAGAGQPLTFRVWTPGAAMIPGAYGAEIPAETKEAKPDILIMPLLAFDAAGRRLGYGGGFYDRTLERLRARRPTLAVGFAYAAQEVDEVPADATDQRLDVIVTETGARRFR